MQCGRKSLDRCSADFRPKLGPCKTHLNRQGSSCSAGLTPRPHFTVCVFVEVFLSRAADCTLGTCGRKSLGRCSAYFRPNLGPSKSTGLVLQCPSPPLPGPISESVFLLGCFCRGPRIAHWLSRPGSLINDHHCRRGQKIKNTKCFATRNSQTRNT